MTLMSLRRTDEILDATEHLPCGAMLVLPQVSWDDYEQLLEGLAERSHVRVSYDCGRLEIVSPSFEHGKYERLIDDLVAEACRVLSLNLEKCGTATWKRRSMSKGVEGDASYYIQNAESIIGKRQVDLDSDPPPDVAGEIDITNDSLHKFPIYAALAVPEVWQYDGQTCRFYALANGRYRKTHVSRFLPGLNGQLLADAIELSKTRGQDAALTTFRPELRRQMRAGK